jgi:heat shock protein HslJ
MMIHVFKFRWLYLVILGLLPALLTARGISYPASGGSLTGVVWQLQNVQFDGSNTSTTINQPASYTIEFQTDGTAHIKADCNTANFGYSTSGYQLTITGGPTTLAYCGSDSHSEPYLQALEHAVSYTLQGDTLTINSGLNGYMNFKKA